MSIAKEQIEKLRKVLELTDEAYAIMEGIEFDDCSDECDVIDDCCVMIDELQTILNCNFRLN